MTLSGMIYHCPHKGIQVSAGNSGKAMAAQALCQSELPSCMEAHFASGLLEASHPPYPISTSLLPLFISFLPAPPPFPVITSQPIPVCHTHTRTQMTAVELGGSGHPSTSQDYGLICRGLQFAKHCHSVTYIISYNLNLGLVISSQQWRKNTVT